MRALYPLLLVGAAWVAPAQGDAPVRIPEVHATTLADTAVELPGSLQGKAGVLVLGFSQGSRDEVAAWGRRLAQDYRESHDVAYYEMAELQSVPRPLRGWVAKKIANSVPDRAKAHFVELNDHEAEWKALCGLANADHACVLLIDRGGVVRWKLEGPVSEERFTALRQRIEPMLQG